VTTAEANATLPHRLDSILRCPVSGEPLRHDGDDRYVSSSGQFTYRIQLGVPVLIRSDHELFADGPERAPDSRDWPPLLRAIRRRLPSASNPIGSAKRFATFAKLLTDGRTDRPRVLIIGGGVVGQGMDDFVRDPRLDLVETDVYRSPRVDVVCDAHDLPFVDGAFDAVVVQAVLGVVMAPERVVQEIHRVLVAGGLVYAETPFMQQVVGGPYDFIRFTDLGHRHLFRRFDEVDRGVVCGPAMSALWSLRYLARSIPRRSLLAAAVLDVGVTIAFFWLKYLDAWLIEHPGARDAASGVYFMGRSRLEAIPDVDIIASYIGTVQIPF
jgi:SAM-dependent methyltransferase